MRVVVLGAYGLIGLETVRRLLRDGHQVVAVGRSTEQGQRVLPDADWHSLDLSEATKEADWHGLLAGVGAVVNCAGALQTGPRDNLHAVHVGWLAAALRSALACGVKRFIQVSAPGAAIDASTEFLRSKAAGDELVRRSGLDWVILKPGLVLARAAYGGTALLRMLASFPLFQPLSMGEARIQTVSVDDVTEAIARAVAGDVPAGTDAALVERESHELSEILLSMRQWLGIDVPRAQVDVPGWGLQVTSATADLLGWLGWRSPLRSTAIAVLRDGVVADAGAGERLLGRELLSFEQTLLASPSTAQDRLAARMALLLPVSVAVLAIFWLVSGLVALIGYDQAVAVAVAAALPGWTVSAGIVTDILLGLGILVRPLAKAAVLGMITVTIAYLLVGTALAPGFWLDPLGVYLKTLPGAVLALVVLPMLETR